jgi:hypothetical protein
MAKSIRKTLRQSRRAPGRSARPVRRGAAREVSDVEVLARKLADVAPDEDPARVAGAIAIFATQTIERSADNLQEARAYPDGLRGAIDGLLRDRFAEDRASEKSRQRMTFAGALRAARKVSGTQPLRPRPSNAGRVATRP